MLNISPNQRVKLLNKLFQSYVMFKCFQSLNFPKFEKYLIFVDV